MERGEATKFDYDFVIVGSGFGGSVSALRLAEKGYSVAVLEAGKRWRAEDFPESNWKIWNWLWDPRLKLHGIMRMTFFRHLTVLSGAGVGGGSLVYANTLLVPPKEVFARPEWGQGEGWYERILPFYETAKRMLGVTRTPEVFAGDELLREYARELGREHTFQPTDVGIFFGKPGETVADPYFGGKGPARTGCSYCGGCMTGCRDGAKNTLDRNYLYLAERLGVRVFPETQVDEFRPLEDPASGETIGWEIDSVRSTSILPKSLRRKPTLRARNLILSAGVLGTLELLMKARERGALPGISPRLGHLVRTNSEAILGATSFDERVDYARGIAIASGVFVNDSTHIEICRYRRTANAVGGLTTLLTDGGGGVPRFLRYLGQIARHPLKFLRSLSKYRWAGRSVILLVMQTLDNHIRMERRRWFGIGPRRLVAVARKGDIPTYIPEGNDAARWFARRMGGVASSSIPEVLFDAPTTAHILGGAAIGSDPSRGVISPGNAVYGAKNLYVVDGSMVPVNLGVNPSLTITALAEHAMSQIPPKEADKAPAPSGNS